MHTTVTEEQLAGLTFNTTREIEQQVEGKTIKVRQADRVPMLPEHVLSSKEVGDVLVIVSADGRKHRIPKAAPPKPSRKKE